MAPDQTEAVASQKNFMSKYRVAGMAILIPVPLIQQNTQN